MVRAFTGPNRPANRSIAMKAMSIPIAILFASAALTAQAEGPIESFGEAQHELRAPTTSGLKRADVVAELLAALRAGYRPSAGEASHEMPMATGMGRSREEVANELRALIKQGVQLPRGEAS
jgi:hypothetical protein